MSNHHNHHNHPSHIHNFFNKHTAVAILLIIVGSFAAGYYVAKHAPWCNGEFRMFKYKQEVNQNTDNWSTMLEGSPYEEGVDYSAQ
jgi:hypothetical protein